MTHLQPICLPEAFVRNRGVDPANVFGWKHHAVCTGPEGERYVLSEIGYNPYRYDDADRDKEETFGHVLARYAPDGTPVAQVFLDWGSSDSIVGDGGYHPGSLSLLPDGRVLYSMRNDRTFAFTPALDAMEEVTAPGAKRWAFRTRLTPSGRALCLLGDNTVALSPEPVGTKLPALTAVTALMRERPPLGHAPRYCPPSGASGEGTPRTELVEQLGAAYGTGLGGPDPENVRDVVPIDDSTFVVVTVGWSKWSGRRGGDFLFALVDADGTLLGHLDLHTYWDSAARGTRYDVVADQGRRRVFHLNTFGLYAFDGSGNRTLHLSTEDKEYKPLAHFQLREFDPTGSLVLVHEKQHLLLTVPVPDDLAELPGAVVDALAHFRKARTRLKKVHQPQNWYWRTSGIPLPSF
ncbi:hypothetical protein [Nocardiopsis alborubida]|uniref:Uncharacterized protein n=1 Tax=Nocardiopsis alborubida TaxID=146802 RepID=A0A7X6RRM5_9ACTN|nr:hypothetical protein [Nocardiopsis alborubida]NKZ00030.1 hypothetical protein [Nocardiopsis alborubida]